MNFLESRHRQVKLFCKQLNHILFQNAIHRSALTNHPQNPILKKPKKIFQVINLTKQAF